MRKEAFQADDRDVPGGRPDVAAQDFDFHIHDIPFKNPVQFGRMSNIIKTMHHTLTLQRLQKPLRGLVYGNKSGEISLKK